MTHDDFVGDPHVNAFVNWLQPRFSTLRVELNIPHHPRFVPGGVHGVFVGVEAVTNAYLWRSTEMTTGDWDETLRHTALLSQNLRMAVANRDNNATLNSAWKVIEWGGGNKTTGAYPFLENLGPNLVPYLLQVQAAFALTTADAGLLVPPVQKMNSMLTKVHAFLATDGLPIYDSRVAVAIGTLVEAWRQDPQSALAATPIPRALHFPTVPARNPERATVTRKFPTATKPAHLREYNTTNCAAWSSAKVRLAWLLQQLLFSNPMTFNAAGAMPDRMRALEAALFMIGYDVNCL